jgi:hypothetical protein
MKNSAAQIALLVVVLVTAGVLAATAAAEGRTIHGELVLNDLTVPDGYLTQACGFDVTITLNVHSPATARLNNAGLVVHEEDIWLGTFTYSAPASGKSVTRPLNAFISTDYPGGAVEGSSAITVGRGVGVGEVTTGQPGSGTVKLAAVVDGFDEASGIPFTHVTEVLSLDGEFDQARASICRALRP